MLGKVVLRVVCGTRCKGIIASVEQVLTATIIKHIYLFIYLFRNKCRTNSLLVSYKVRMTERKTNRKIRN
jgi:hypothetical protein